MTANVRARGWQLGGNTGGAEALVGSELAPEVRTKIGCGDQAQRPRVRGGEAQGARAIFASHRPRMQIAMR